ncbi:hypothetical protein EFK07_05410 [Pseudomonas putida]|uniref:Uncharacterized protein n=1 Tax=Pseudomonas putida TaxID=303 RepID=A0A3M8TH34_PSEPU|nr:hypothetical protein EFK07_05410 [Pseudomonas putida]
MACGHERCVDAGQSPYAVPVGAALCRERAATRPQDFRAPAQIYGAASQPFRDARPLPHYRVTAQRLTLAAVSTQSDNHRPLLWRHRHHRQAAALLHQRQFGQACLLFQPA